MDQLTPVTIKIPEDLRRYLRILAAQDDVSQSDIVARLISREKAKRERSVPR